VAALKLLELHSALPTSWIESWRSQADAGPHLVRRSRPGTDASVSDAG